MINHEKIARDFSSRRYGFMNYEPVFIDLVDGQPVVYRTYIRCCSNLQAVRISEQMRSQFNDGLWIMKEHPLQKETSDD